MISVNAIKTVSDNLIVMENQQLTSCSESLEIVQRLTDLSYDSATDEVICLMCGARRKKLYFHLRKDHNLSQSEYKSKFPEARLFNNFEMNYRNSSFLVKGRSLDEATNDIRKEKVSKKTKEFHKNFWINSSDPKVIKRSRQMSQACIKGLKSQSRSRVFEYKGVTYKLRSKLEFVVVKSLVDHNLDWEYESLDFEVEGHGVLPDFYVRSLNLIIEPKGSYYYNKKSDYWNLVCSKISSLGYKYALLIDVDKEFNPNTLSDKLDTSGSAIIYDCVI